LFTVGIASIFALANQYHSTTGEINNLTSKYISSPFVSVRLCAYVLQLEYFPPW